LGRLRTAAAFEYMLLMKTVRREQKTRNQIALRVNSSVFPRVLPRQGSAIRHNGRLAAAFYKLRRKGHGNLRGMYLAWG